MVRLPEAGEDVHAEDEEQGGHQGQAKKQIMRQFYQISGSILN